jgi:hypothetical protein
LSWLNNHNLFSPNCFLLFGLSWILGWCRGFLSWGSASLRLGEFGNASGSDKLNDFGLVLPQSVHFSAVVLSFLDRWVEFLASPYVSGQFLVDLPFAEKYFENQEAIWLGITSLWEP